MNGCPFNLSMKILSQRAGNISNLNLAAITRVGYNDVGDGCRRPNVLVTSLRC